MKGFTATEKSRHVVRAPMAWQEMFVTEPTKTIRSAGIGDDDAPSPLNRVNVQACTAPPTGMLYTPRLTFADGDRDAILVLQELR